MLATPKEPETEPRTHILGYACEWVSGNSDEDDVIDDILSNGFEENYTWDGNCEQLSSDFLRLATSLGITTSQHRWKGRNFVVGDMSDMRTISMDPVGSEYPQRVYEFEYHQWSEVASLQIDPTTASTKSGNWGDYEDYFFSHYERITSSGPYIWDVNMGC